MNINGVRTHIFIGSIEILRCPHLLIESVRRNPLLRFEITLPDPDGALCRSVKLGAAVTITLGYRDKAPAIWNGTVKSVRPGNKDQIVVSGVGRDDELLNSVCICQSWENETPEAIVKYAAAQTGLPIARIDSPGVHFPRFISSSIPVWQVARQAAETCQNAFNLDMSAWKIWRGPDGIHWGDHDQDGNGPIIATGAGLIKHMPANDVTALNEVETFLIPDLMHSRFFGIQDNRRGIDDWPRALEVRHVIKETSARTHIRYGVEYGY